MHAAQMSYGLGKHLTCYLVLTFGHLKIMLYSSKALSSVLSAICKICPKALLGDTSIVLAKQIAMNQKRLQGCSNVVRCLVMGGGGGMAMVWEGNTHPL